MKKIYLVFVALICIGFIGYANKTPIAATEPLIPPIFVKSTVNTNISMLSSVWAKLHLNNNGYWIAAPIVENGSIYTLNISI